MTLQSNRLLKPEKFQADDTDAEVRRNTFARLSSYFGNGFLRASEEIGERPFLFFGDCPAVLRSVGGASSDRPPEEKSWEGNRREQPWKETGDPRLGFVAPIRRGEILVQYQRSKGLGPAPIRRDIDL